MRVIIQRVKKGSVDVNGSTISAIEKGLVLFLGIENSDTSIDVDWICNKVSQLRIFDDENKTMNKYLKLVNSLYMHLQKKEIDHLT